MITCTSQRVFQMFFNGFYFCGGSRRQKVLARATRSFLKNHHQHGSQTLFFAPALGLVWTWCHTPVLATIWDSRRCCWPRFRSSRRHWLPAGMVDIAHYYFGGPPALILSLNPTHFSGFRSGPPNNVGTAKNLRIASHGITQQTQVILQCVPKKHMGLGF